MENAADSQQPALQALNSLFLEWTGHLPLTLEAIPLAGSDRRYYRLRGTGRSAIGVYSQDQLENRAFLAFSRHFRSKAVPVPEIFVENQSQTAYLQQDLGDMSLLQKLDELRKSQIGPGFPAAAIQLYQRSLEELAKMQIIGGQGLDYSLCIPRPDFDLQSIRWDLSYFKYYFLRAIKVPHDEQALEDDFERLAGWLLETDCSNFMFRDFQARNIMLLGNEPYFIDYQGGRRGALQYDVASLLYQAKADLPESLRESLLDHYITAAQAYTKLNPAEFKAHYRGTCSFARCRCWDRTDSGAFLSEGRTFWTAFPTRSKMYAPCLMRMPCPLHFPPFGRPARCAFFGGFAFPQQKTRDDKATDNQSQKLFLQSRIARGSQRKWRWLRL
jgi:aminoglycoside/choline kinase family phosphotransferase